VPHVEEAEARATASRLLDVIAGTVFHVGENEVHLTASMGLVRFPKDGVDFNELMAHADLAMYEAKTSGGNQLLAYTPETVDSGPRTG
jgi:diguanylate cyclase (GGDEF)-like protein